MSKLWFSEAGIERGAQALHGERGLAWDALTEQEREQRRSTVCQVLEAVLGRG